MSYALVATANFDRGMKRLSSTDLNRSRQTLEEIARNPYSFKELKGRFKDLRSARFGKHRIIHDHPIEERGHLTSSRTEKLRVRTMTAYEDCAIIAGLRIR